MPTMANIHIDVFLSNLSIAYMNEAYQADTVFPVVPVPLRSDKYVVYNKDTFLKSSGVDKQGKASSIRRPGVRSTMIQWDISNQSYYAEQLARNSPVYDAQVRYADNPLNIEIDTTKALTETIKLDNEVQVATKTMTRANYASGNKAQLTTGGTGTSWAQFGSANSLPITNDFTNAKKAVIKGILRPPTHFLADYDVCTTLAQNPDVTKRLQYVSKETYTMSGLLPILSGLIVVEAMQFKATNQEGAAVTTGYCWTDDQGQDAALFFYRPANATGLRTVSFGLTFDAPDDTLGSHNYAIKRWREEWIDADILEARVTRDWRFTCTDGSTNGDNAGGYATGGYLVSGCLL